MISRRLILSLLSFLCLFGGLSCGDDDDGGIGSGDADADVDGDTETYGDGGTGSVECLVMEDCESGYCESFQNMPSDPNAHCADPPPDGTINLIGNVRDFETDKYLAGVDVHLAGAAQASSNANAAYNEPLIVATTNEDGFFEAREYKWDIKTAVLGIVGLVQEDGYAFSSSGLQEPQGESYPYGVLNRDVIVVSEATRDKWKALMEKDSVLSKFELSCMGRAQYVVDGTPVKGIVLRSSYSGSEALVYYLNEAQDGFNTERTSSNGMFLIVNPGLVEGFEAYRGSTKITPYTAKAGQTDGVVFTITMPIYARNDPGA